MLDPSAGPDPPLGFPDPPRDRFECLVRFFFGALLGILVGAFIWVRCFLGTELGWIAIPISVLVCAFSAAHYGDNFWLSFPPCVGCDGGDYSVRLSRPTSNQTMKLTATFPGFGDAVLVASFLSPQIDLSAGGRSLSYSR
jgi:hypothetical protein